MIKHSKILSVMLLEDKFCYLRRKICNIVLAYEGNEEPKFEGAAREEEFVYSKFFTNYYFYIAYINLYT
jgi:hypothetical protein